MELKEIERDALTKWMTAKGLSMMAAAQILQLDSASSIHRWLKGGGIRAAQYAKLLEHIKPYIKEPRQLGSSFLDRIEAPTTIELHNDMIRVKRYLQSIGVDLSRFDDKKLPAAKSDEEIFGSENRAYRDHEAPLRLAAGGGIPQAPTMARNAIIEGDSMDPVYRHGQEVAISHFSEPITLGSAVYIDYAYIKERLKSGGHYWLQLNDGGLTVKGLELEPPDERGVWRLILVAENPHWGEEFGYRQGRRALHFGETLQVYGTVKKIKNIVAESKPDPVAAEGKKDFMTKLNAFPPYKSIVKMINIPLKITDKYLGIDVWIDNDGESYIIGFKDKFNESRTVRQSDSKFAQDLRAELKAIHEGSFGETGNINAKKLAHDLYNNKP